MKSLLFVLSVITAVAFIPPQQNQQYTVGEVIRKARQLDRDSTTVKLTGYVVKKQSDGWYLFVDKTAEIKVSIDNQYLPAKPFDDRIAVVIYALVQYEINKPVTLKVNRPVSEE
ncbi:NirD/YgiW/YdeI family stress tolerance protein [Chitinophaga sp. Cy-1792]|uniref:NirD/YgiW/YdeI family stress tolerance protein n=1 Tax=Chitinophaga sp. Cy-1792 TaxID=2608339 RepID=UPI001422AFDF|nr:NirD/YgiW/YdeI family stress tolerance protein [Chitinophaga sp. Cy-1792]NIG54594.1 NirD/YgiW/YdeI family stress tolerance protein [Chitinophaga sp. Cy-1792]